MIENDAYELIQQYVSGWKQNNIHLITTCLAENCIVIESHGPIYHSIPEIERWFKLWLEAKSVVLEWDITSFVFFEDEKTAFCEWNFSCISNNTQHAFPGISVIKFSDHKIIFIHEYRMTKPAYEWKGDELKSD